jgi:hypothetical protein
MGNGSISGSLIAEELNREAICTDYYNDLVMRQISAKCLESGPRSSDLLHNANMFDRVHTRDET